VFIQQRKVRSIYIYTSNLTSYKSVLNFRRHNDDDHEDDDDDHDHHHPHAFKSLGFVTLSGLNVTIQKSL
jgi:ABC-type Zn2+ transport system substrate-binding protein/surface adhesin